MQDHQGSSIRGGQQELSGLWVVFLGGVLQQPQSLCWLFPTVHQGFPQCCGAGGGGGRLLMNSTLKSRPSWGLSILGPIQGATLSILSAPMGDLVADLDGWNSPLPALGRLGHSGDIQVLVCLFWGLHRSLCVPPSPWRSWEAIETPPLIADVAPQPGDTVPQRGHWSVVTGGPPESCGWVGPGGPPRFKASVPHGVSVPTRTVTWEGRGWRPVGPVGTETLPTPGSHLSAASVPRASCSAEWQVPKQGMEEKKYVTLCDNGLLTYHPSLHVSGGLLHLGRAGCGGPGGHGAAGLWGWREEHLSSESPCSWERALLWGLRGPKARCLKALRLGRALWVNPPAGQSPPGLDWGASRVLLPPLELF